MASFAREPRDASVEIGLLLPSREAALHNGDQEMLLRCARQAEAIGLHSVWAGDSIVAKPRFEPLTLLAAVAATTSHVKLGTAVLLPLRHPLLAAHQIATLDRLAEGRLIVGLGAGASVPSTEADLGAAGVNYERRVAWLYDTARLWRKLWDGEEVDHVGPCGSYVGVQLRPTPHTHGGPQLWIAGEGPYTLSKAGSWYDGWLTFSVTPDAFASGLRDVRQAASDSGRDANDVVPAAFLTLTIGEPTRARRDQAAYIEAYYGVPYDFMSAVQACHAGSAESTLEWLQAYVNAGARQLVIRLGTLDDADGQLAALRPIVEELVG